MRLRDLKDALKGTRKRLERAEELLERANMIVYDAYYFCDNDTLSAKRYELFEKIEVFLGSALDTSE